MFSERLGRTIAITDHARERMAAREISETLLADMIETGEVKYRDQTRIWIAKRYEDRDDNLLCLAAVLETV